MGDGRQTRLVMELVGQGRVTLSADCLAVVMRTLAAALLAR
jgi:hypothetical protein